MPRSERLPRADDIVMPVYVPSSNGVTSIEMAKATLKAGVLIVEFAGTFPAIAIQTMLERGVILGMSFVMINPDEKNLRAQERLAQEEKDAEDIILLNEDQDAYPEKYLPTEPNNEGEN